jgi:hypothetical protein
VVQITSAGVIWPFFFPQETVTSSVYFDMLKNFVMPKVPDGYTFQQDGASSHYWTSVTESLNEHFSGRWMGCSGPIP